MTRDEIMKMDVWHLYFCILQWLSTIDKSREYNLGGESLGAAQDMGLALYLCYQAEEKVKEAGKADDYIDILFDVLPPIEASTFDCIHAHPRDRARAILLTIGEKEGYENMPHL